MKRSTLAFAVTLALLAGPTRVACLAGGGAETSPQDAEPTAAERVRSAIKEAREADKKSVIFIAGRRSHGFGGHDHLAGCHLLAAALERSGLPIVAAVYYPGWPEDDSILEGADAVVIYADGGGGHPATRRAEHMETLDRLAQKGAGIGCLHYAVEVPKGAPGDHMLRWTGGYFETHWSVNPHWLLTEAVLAKNHPVTRGVEPFEVHDEWYYHMRFRKDMEGVTPILSAHPPKSTLERPDGPHSGNSHVREAVEKGELQHVMWAATRDGSGRGFGFTGGHVHWNWAHPEFRQLVLNAIAWIARIEVPEDGVKSERPSLEELLSHHDDMPDDPAKVDREAIRRRVEAIVREEH